MAGYLSPFRVRRSCPITPAACAVVIIIPAYPTIIIVIIVHYYIAVIRNIGTRFMVRGENASEFPRGPRGLRKVIRGVSDE